MSHRSDLPNGLIAYGPDTNCTLSICPVSASVYEYRPSLAANGTFIGLFGICMIITLAQFFKWRTWWFTITMALGCICEILGYGGRIMLYQNPFSFNGFLMQIICITIAPVFYTAAIYFTLAKIVTALGPQYSRFRPNLFFYVFLTSDIISLVLQAAGGAMSSNSTGSDKVGVDISLAGLSFQVFSLLVFIVLALDYAWRWRKAEGMVTELPKKFKIFTSFLSLSIILILVRCAYRIDELSNGYNGPLIHDEGLFIGLEGVMIILAAFSLSAAHPGPVFGDDSLARKEVYSVDNMEMSEEPKSQQHV